MNESTTSDGTTTVRPRNRRRIHEDEDGKPSSGAAPSAFLDGTSTSASSSRIPSPLPKSNPSQATRTSHQTSRLNNANGLLSAPNAFGSQTASSNLAGGFFESSWASLQGIASSLMGNDGSRVSSPNRSPNRKRRPFETAYGVRNTSAPPARWGPSGNSDKQIAIGTEEDRRAQVQARKREALLAANGYGGFDATRHYKRRDSDDRVAETIETEERESLVYLHRVRPNDTLAGVAIKYSCPPTVFQKANRLWANDSIQIRKIAILPVDACGVRGRKMEEPPGGIPPSQTTYDGTTSAPKQTQQPPQRQSSEATTYPHHPTETSISSIPTSPSISVTLSNSNHDSEPPWTHDSWVQIDGFPDPVEIARLSRKALGYFPRGRRKSQQSFSDLETPSASFDLPRPSYQHSTGGGHEVLSPPLPPLSSSNRRSSVQSSRTRASSMSQFAKQLHGPGGVGTMRSNVRSPGPAQDGLNKMFAAHLPNMAPKSSFESLRLAAAAGAGATSSSYSGGSVGSGSGSGGLENVGGAIEGWVRKMATRAATGLREGDLIELSEDGFGSDRGDGGGGAGDDDMRRGRTARVGGGGTHTRASASEGGAGVSGGSTTTGRANAITGWTAEEQEQMLHDHFQPRGRVFMDSSRKGGRSG